MQPAHSAESSGRYGSVRILLVGSAGKRSHSLLYCTDCSGLRASCCLAGAGKTTLARQLCDAQQHSASGGQTVGCAIHVKAS